MKYLSGLLDDDRIYGIGVDLLGPDFVLDQTEGRLRVGPTPWHGSTARENGLRFIKIGFYLDALTRETGCLRVLPGSHLPGTPDLLAPLRTRNDDPAFAPFGLAPAEVPCVALEVVPGDLVVFTEQVLHGAFGGRPGRHQHAVSFFSNPTTEAQIEELKEIYRTTNWSVRPTEDAIDCDRPRLRRMVARLVELGFESLKV